MCRSIATSRLLVSACHRLMSSSRAFSRANCSRRQSTTLLLIGVSLGSPAVRLLGSSTQEPAFAGYVNEEPGPRRDDRGAILECLAAGASGYIPKSTPLDQFMRAIETILSGGVFAPAALAGLQQSVAPAHDTEATNLALHLTERQIEVFDLLSQGCATKTIARRLGLAVGTMKVHLALVATAVAALARELSAR